MKSFDAQLSVTTVQECDWKAPQHLARHRIVNLSV